MNPLRSLTLVLTFGIALAQLWSVNAATPRPLTESPIQNPIPITVDFSNRTVLLNGFWKSNYAAIAREMEAQSLPTNGVALSNTIAAAISGAPSVFATDTSTGLVLNITKPLVNPTNEQAAQFVTALRDGRSAVLSPTNLAFGGMEMWDIDTNIAITTATGTAQIGNQGYTNSFNGTWVTASPGIYLTNVAPNHWALYNGTGLKYTNSQPWGQYTSAAIGGTAPYPIVFPKMTPRQPVFYPAKLSIPTATQIGGVVGAVTNHAIISIGGALRIYWSDGVTVYGKDIAP